MGLSCCVAEGLVAIFLEVAIEKRVKVHGVIRAKTAFLNKFLAAYMGNGFARRKK